MKKFMIFLFIIFMIALLDTTLFSDTIYNIYDRLINKTNYKIVENSDILKGNNYYKEDVSDYVSTTDSLVARNKQELLDIYYSAINKGYDKLTFYCDEGYTECGNDIAYLNNEDSNFSYTNQLVSVYNSYKSISSSYSSNLRVDISIDKKYKQEDIDRIDNELINIINRLGINNYDSLYDKIKAFHDYIANINTYDEVMANTGQSDYNSDSAIGALFEGKAICSGYTDAMSLFLDMIGVENYRVATNDHVWNALKMNGRWYHIDLTWDDPIVSDGSNIIQYEYFMITTDELLRKNDPEHLYNKNVYSFIY